MNKPIYTITAIRYTMFFGSRTVGFYYDFKTADEDVRNNGGDINEAGYYPYVVIEEIEEGLYIYPRNCYWYAWNRVKNKYESCEEPDRFKKIAGWGIG